MININITQFLIVCPLVFLAGFVDSIAGGGGLISLQAYLMAGIPIHSCLGTNKLSSSMGAVTASYRYWKGGFVDILLCLPSIAAALAGSAAGSSLSLLVAERYLRMIVLVIVPVVGVYVFIKKDLQSAAEPFGRGKTMILAAAISFVVGAYDGFIGPGTGTFLILLFSGLARIEVRMANGQAKMVNLASNLAALAVFVANGRVLYPLGLCAGLFSIAGSWLGSGLAIRRGAKLIRVFVMIVLVLLFAKTVWDVIH